MEQFVAMAQNIIGLMLQAFALFLQLIIWVLTFLIEMIRELFVAVF